MIKTSQSALVRFPTAHLSNHSLDSHSIFFYTVYVLSFNKFTQKTFIFCKAHLIVTKKFKIWQQLDRKKTPKLQQYISIFLTKNCVPFYKDYQATKILHICWLHCCSFSNLCLKTGGSKKILCQKVHYEYYFLLLWCHTIFKTAKLDRSW